jgi:hypothetical protein
VCRFCGHTSVTTRRALALGARFHTRYFIVLNIAHTVQYCNICKLPPPALASRLPPYTVYSTTVQYASRRRGIRGTVQYCVQYTGYRVEWYTTAVSGAGRAGAASAV